MQSRGQSSLYMLFLLVVDLEYLEIQQPKYDTGFGAIGSSLGDIY